LVGRERVDSGGQLLWLVTEAKEDIAGEEREVFDLIA